jgi:CubicO group peptidase (beta-lactamase class C family)
MLFPILLIVLIAGSMTSRAEVPLPQTVAGRLLGQYLYACNSADRATLRTFIAENFLIPHNDPAFVDRMVADESNRYRLSQGLVVEQLVESSDAAIKVLARARATGAWSEISLFVTAAPPDYQVPAAPYQIVALGVSGVPTPRAALSRKKLSDAEIARRTGALVSFLAGADAFSGTVYVARNGKKIYGQAFGLASKTWNIRNRIDTRFNLASITKMFTAVAVAQLVEQGKLSYEDTVAAVLPAYPNQEVARQVTIHQLLSHTSGLIGARALAEKGSEPLTAKSVASRLPLFVDEPLSFRPGQRFDYSNAGFVLLGLIVEKASGQSYYDYVRDHVFRPAGMTDTDFIELEKDPPNLADGFMDAPDGTRLNNILVHTAKGAPDTGAFSTGADMVRFHQALAGHKLLNEKSVSRLWTGVTEEPGNHREYGYGAYLEGLSDQQVVSHGGGAPGVTNRFEMYPRAGVSVVILSNIDDDPAAIAHKIREWMMQGHQEQDPAAESAPELSVAVSVSTSSIVGASTAITVSITNTGGTAHACIVDLEILDASGVKVNQQVTEGQKLHGGGTRIYRHEWTPPAAGVYTVNLGVFGAGWRPKIRFDTAIATIAVR